MVFLLSPRFPASKLPDSRSVCQGKNRITGLGTHASPPRCGPSHLLSVLSSALLSPSSRNTTFSVGLHIPRVVLSLEDAPSSALSPHFNLHRPESNVGVTSAHKSNVLSDR